VLAEAVSLRAGGTLSISRKPENGGDKVRAPQCTHTHTHTHTHMAATRYASCSVHTRARSRARTHTRTWRRHGARPAASRGEAPEPLKMSRFELWLRHWAASFKAHTRTLCVCVCVYVGSGAEVDIVL
jgi:hypothetical protein